MSRFLTSFVFGPTPGNRTGCTLVEEGNEETKEAWNALGIKETKRHPQLAGRADYAAKLDEDADGHRVDPEHEGGEGVEDGVANEDTEG